MILILLPLLIMIVGALIYGFASNPKLCEIGRILFACGAFVLTWKLAGQTWHLG